jgi:hypothetical protein
MGVGCPDRSPLPGGVLPSASYGPDPACHDLSGLTKLPLSANASPALAHYRAIHSVKVTGHSRHVSRTGRQGATFASAAARSEMRPSGDTPPPTTDEVHLQADQLAQRLGARSDPAPGANDNQWLRKAYEQEGNRSPGFLPKARCTFMSRSV